MVFACVKTHFSVGAEVRGILFLASSPWWMSGWACWFSSRLPRSNSWAENVDFASSHRLLRAVSLSLRSTPLGLIDKCLPLFADIFLRQEVLSGSSSLPDIGTIRWIILISWERGKEFFLRLQPIGSESPSAHGQRSLVGYSPYSRKELDTT